MIRQLTHLKSPRVGCDLVGQLAVRYQKVVAYYDQAGGRNNSAAGVTEHVDIGARRNIRREFYLVFVQEICDPRRLNAEHQDHWGLLEALKGDVIAGTNFHVVSPSGLCFRGMSKDCGGISPRRGIRSR